MARGAYAYCVCGAPAVWAPWRRGALHPRRPRAAVWGAPRAALRGGPGAEGAGAGADGAEGGGSEEGEVEPREPVELFREAEAGADGGGGGGGGGSGQTRELPLFPLQVVLNPGGAIPLYIFELKYRLLFNRIHDGDSLFGVVLKDGDAERLARVGCAAELLRFEPLPDGRIVTSNRGTRRFRILRILGEDPYIRAEVEFLDDHPPSPDCAHSERAVWAALQDVLRLSNKLYEKSKTLSPDINRLAPREDAPRPAGAGAGAGADADADADDARRMQDFSFAVAESLDMPLSEQQRLLQMRDTGKRLARQAKMLNTARQFLAAQVTIKEAGLPEW